MDLHASRHKASADFTGQDALTEQSLKIAQMGGNQMKLRLSPQSTCKGYHISCASSVTSLKRLAQVPAVAGAFAQADLVWYQIWSLLLLYLFIAVQSNEDDHEEFMKEVDNINDGKASQRYYT